MNLFDKDKPGQTIFFSPDQITAAKTQQKKLEAEQEQTKLTKEQKKEHKTAEHELKAQEIHKRKETKQTEAASKCTAKIHA